MSDADASGRRIADYPLPDLGRSAAMAAGGAAPPVVVEEGGFIPLFTQEQTEDPVEAAVRQAQETLDAALIRAEEIKTQAREQGYREGYAGGQEEGRLAARARIEAAVDNLGRALKVLDAARAGILAVMEEELVGLVQAACDRVLMQAGASDPDLARRAVREAAGRLARAERLVVHVSPDDLAQIEEYRPRLLAELDELGHLEIKADAGVAPGGCRVDAPEAQVDASLPTRRQQVFAALTAAFHREGGLDAEALLDEALTRSAAAADPAPEPAPPAPTAAAAQAAPEPEPAPAPAEPEDLPALEEW
ncbi:MAG: FliH/SctL family protein [Pseudomonadota bacterium]